MEAYQRRVGCDITMSEKPEQKRKIIGDMCRCGHLKCVHDSVQFAERHLERDEEHGHIVGRNIIDFENQGTIKGHGACTLCPCPKFTWVRFVYEGESDER